MVSATGKISELVIKGLKKGTDYGNIPGTDTAVLLKPGAEQLCTAFGVKPHYEIVEQEIDHDRPVSYEKRVYNNAYNGDRSFRMEPATTYGLYRYVIRCDLRNSNGDTVTSGIASCSTFESKYISRPRDSENTVLKMAQKRALVGVCLNAFGLSGRFTQDVDEHPPAQSYAKPQNARPAQKPKPAPKKEPAEKFDKGNEKHVERLSALLTKMEVVTGKWDEVAEALQGKEMTQTEVKAVVDKLEKPE